MGSYLTKNQINLTAVYMISVVTQLVGFGIIAGTEKINWIIVPLLIVSALVYTICYYKVFSD